MLTIVPTPIGNLKDITLRSLEALQDCDGIICEDTRRTSLLLNNYQIKKELFILNDFNEKAQLEKIISIVQTGNYCLVSDAGTPLVSDPGFKLIRECLAKNIKVDSLPGASSILPALTLSGLPPNSFYFCGYPPDKPGHRKQLWEQLKAISELSTTTFIVFMAPFKVNKTLVEMIETLGDVEVVLARELTKIHQEVKKQTISQWLAEFKKKKPRGEYVALVYLPQGSTKNQ
ncbi:16S rRNA (cytidine(1402)-2'-O)-methyltransferase [Candidatus Daviesbacteria bacterium RIFCSPHIGHO2_01_FULL_44_29]|uniref:Ribosomal RNA small subunit methyltransferase I n=1 Tax=Candidatus Daviesbacteria bacterium RIFCSPHIGHO2_02_FULL_43_12 TaxID=1797776 RepID=A0A1F5KJU0_9BACT|nr:MAG: 16S rRNA (cytidine(1402)-2'-O)-methyltransferase [Candidatus Daviesbacteria bacterium RIFCSPHIGHO2_01_FULL_44_29]OGE39546.1 MAG: 16S rRNA (cytidine(1402)-2'-O)-methyltransferase [Candidatus Daviesbacteria bacterium RIFCSPHIGHO2_12_FULL_47_45]OGE41178.1 MAG: 16S rRNA (cytidine(1402)-2'-O)-methyltransferase [Candidatus Daviesbacteria bacterium RIFCSPHIGHO2_02_FULL_43_12]OGE69377.1 MAG: 16S rRNA (cytidine(1402)-2'-O)-methyltransferase [Candidatus Daviesbacteria bacterium RIFCSPLOWO2_01_FULL